MGVLKRGIIVAIILFACWVIGKATHPQQEADTSGKLEQVQPEITNEITESGMDESQGKFGGWNLTFENVNTVSDNPWGITAGMIQEESEGECIFLTPNTSVVIDGLDLEMIKTGVSMDFEIHPWVSENSDGAGIIVWYMNDAGKIIAQDEWAISNQEAWQEYILHCDSEDVTKVKLLCNNGENDDDSADWVLICEKREK